MIPSTNPLGTSATNATSTTTATQAAAKSTSSLANTDTFLKLLVAQIQNQDPAQPTDGAQFLTQLAQFSSLEQLVSINQGIGTLSTDLTTTPPATTSTNTVSGS